MLTINPTVYQQLGELLVECIGSMSYLSEDIFFEDSDYDYHFSATLIIRFVDELYPEGELSEIVEIIPVWWEFSSVGEEGEVLNDFDFNILKESICR